MWHRKQDLFTKYNSWTNGKWTFVPVKLDDTLAHTSPSLDDLWMLDIDKYLKQEKKINNWVNSIYELTIT